MRLSIEPEISVEGDAELLSEMFNNLIENALVHSPPHALISVNLGRDLGGVTATISDNGPGLPVAERVPVLQRFYRLEYSRSLPGTGLGLSPAAAIAHLHRAELATVDNDPGLIVSIRFPL